MNLDELKLINLKIDKQKLGKIYTFVDFGNVNYWFEHDEKDGEDNILPKGSKLVIGIKELSKLTELFSTHTRFYYGLDPKTKKSWRITALAREYFNKTITKPIQYVRRYLDTGEELGNTRPVAEDVQGKYIKIPKCNFDVEICVDTVRFLKEFDTFCLFSSDADFAYLLEFLKRHHKKIILFSSGYVSHWLKDKVDININSQQVKNYITFIKQKPRL